MGRGLIGGAAQAIQGNFGGAINSILAPLAGPFAPILSAIIGKMNIGGDKRAKLEAGDIQKVKIVDFQDFATTMANISKRFIIGGGARGLTSTRTASAIAGVSRV